MGKVSDTQLHRRIERILQRHPNASSMRVRQQLMINIRPSCLYTHLIPFYEQYLIDDSHDIRRELKRMMSLHLGLSVIVRTVSSGCYNYLQVEKALLELNSNFEPLEQAMRCKELHFGVKPPRDEHHHSEMVMTLQRLGHRLPEIWRVLRHADET
ncbi:hypothetical protein F7U66_00395 [Vibrio parahaemolyticus]|nr:hypothetical protein [Vibrio parahaemolyticus]